jgi:hypothetical protein
LLRRPLGLLDSANNPLLTIPLKRRRNNWPSNTWRRYPERDVSINPFKFARNFFSDQKKIYYAFPTSLARGRHLVPVAAVLGTSAALALAVDPTEARYFRRHEATFEGFNNSFPRTAPRWARF